MKTSWFDIILFVFASFAGAFLYQWISGDQDWAHATEYGITSFICMISFGFFTQFSNRD